jgi:hypothetical protein
MKPSSERAAFYPGKNPFLIGGDIARLLDQLAMDARFDVAFPAPGKRRLPDRRAAVQALRNARFAR